MLKSIKQFLLYDSSSSGNLKNVQAQVMEENRRFAIIWASAQMLYWLYCLIMSTVAPDFRMC